MTQPNPRVLIIETSGRIGHVGLAREADLLESRHLDEARRHAGDLVPALADLLTRQAWKPDDIDVVLVSHGPGSYTGLRVGIISAKTFAYATGCRLLALETFAALVRQVPTELSHVDVIADAQQDRIYVQRFVRDERTACWAPAAPLSIEPLTDWLARRESRVWVTGPGVRVYRGRLSPRTNVVDAEFWDPRPESLLQIGLARYRAGERDDIWSLEPLYLRPSSAEEKWRAVTSRPS